MNSKIINPSQYKKISKTNSIKRSEKIENKIKRGKYDNINDEINITVKNDNNSSKKRIFLGILLIAIMTFLSIISASLLDLDKVEYIAVVTNNVINTINKDFEFKIGINNLDLNKNVLVNELKKVSYNKLLDYDNDYNISLKLAKNVEKKDELTYVINFENVGINQTVKDTIKKIRDNKENIYYNAMINITKLEIDGDFSLIIHLSSPNDYFIYYLDFPIDVENEKIQNVYEYNLDMQNISIKLNKISETMDILSSISVINYTDSLNMVNDFKEEKLEMFLTSSDDDLKLLNRYDYDSKKYRDGETLFILGNPKSKLFKQEEVRKAIMYSIDRTKIAKQISTTFAEIIDIPYIYSDIKYKYDTYAVDNVLITNNWEYKNDIYVKRLDNKENLNLKIRILVNKDDNIKVLAANMIKDMLEKSKIQAEIIEAKSNNINEALKGENYDIAIAKVSLTKSPDVSYLYDYINITDKSEELIKKVKNSNINTISEAVNELKDDIQNEVLCIGIFAKNVNVITRKDLVGFDNISFMNIFSNIKNIGK